MSMAPPGTSTGRFYIILGYIPRKRTWQELKDFVHQAGFQVAHVQIHTGLHSGWICVDGEDNFWSLGKWLAQAEWDGNRFQVDMRNFDQETPLGPSSYVPLETPPSARSSYSLASGAPTTSSVNGNAQYAYSYKPVPQVATTQAYSCGSDNLGYAVTSPQQYSFGGLVSPTYATSFAQPLMYSQTGIQQTSSAPTYQYGYAPYPTTTNTVASPPFTPPPSLSLPPATIRVENRRLHLTRTSGTSSEKEIRKRVLAACPPHAASPIEVIEIPTHADGRQRGHALILLQTEELARRVRDRLDGMNVKGSDGKKHALKVKFAQEGATEKSEELAMRMAGLKVKEQDSDEQGPESKRVMQGSGEGNDAADEQPPHEDGDNGRAIWRGSLPIANGSSLVLPGEGLYGSATARDDVDDCGVVGGDAKEGREEKQGRKHKERAAEKKHHVSSGGKSSGKNKGK